MGTGYRKPTLKEAIEALQGRKEPVDKYRLTRIWESAQSAARIRHLVTAWCPAQDRQGLIL